MSVCFKYTFETLTFRIKDVSVKGEAMRCAARVIDSHAELATESKGWELLVGIIEL